MGTFQCRVVLLNLIMVGQGHTVLAVGAGAGCSDIFFLRLPFLFSSSYSLRSLGAESRKKSYAKHFGYKLATGLHLKKNEF